MTYDDTNSRNAVYGLNSYVWKLLQANLGWKASDYGGSMPIIPSAQQPEFMQNAKPFLVYGAAHDPAGDLYAIKCQHIGYNIYSTSSTEANRVANLLAETFERQDEAAADVNLWLAVEGKTGAGGGNRAAGKRQFAFTTLRLSMVEQAEPADEEGGYSSALVLLRADYILEKSASAPVTAFTTF